MGCSRPQEPLKQFSYFDDVSYLKALGLDFSEFTRCLEEIQKNHNISPNFISIPDSGLDTQPDQKISIQESSYNNVNLSDQSISPSSVFVQRLIGDGIETTIETSNLCADGVSP